LHLPVGAGRAALDQAVLGQEAAWSRLCAIEQQPVADGGVRARWQGRIDARALDLQAAAMHGDDAGWGRC